VLAPAALLAALVLVTTAGHLIRSDLAWLGLVVVAVGTLPVLLVRRGGGDRTFIVRCAALAAWWAMGSWAAGINDPLVLGSGSVGGALAIVLWVRRQSPRSRIEVVDGSRWPWRRDAWRWRRTAMHDLSPVASTWPWIARVVGVPGASLQRAVAHPDDGYALHIELPRGRLGTDVNLPRLHSALRLPTPVVLRVPDPNRPWRIALEEVPEPEPDELHDAEPSPPPSVGEDGGRQEALRLAVARAGPRAVSARELARLAEPELPRDWVVSHIKELAPALGLRRVEGGWQRLAVEETKEERRWAG
jgi:hypothetical protein